MPGTDELRNTLAAALGIEAAEIRATNPRWLQLLREGVIVSLHIGRWRAKTSLHWRDLGFEPGCEEEERALADLIEPGYKRLLPREILRRLDAIESKARSALESHAFKTHWGWFVPVTAWPEWKAEDERIRAAYLGVLDELLTGYDPTVERVLAEYRVASRATYRRLTRLHPEMVEQVAEEEFADGVVQTIQARIPSPEALRASFYYDVELAYVPLPSLLAEEEARAARIRAQSEAERERVGLRGRLERERVRAEEEKVRAEVSAARSAAEWKEQLMRQMHQEVIGQARKRKEQMVDSFLRDVVAQLRSLMYEVSTSALATMQRNGGRLHPRSVVQLKNLVEQLQRLNFSGDREVEEIVADIASHLGEPPKDRSPQEIERTLREVAIVARATLVGLGERPRSARALGIPDEPPETLVRQIRRRRLEEPALSGLPGLDSVPRRRQARGSPVPGQAVGVAA